MLHQLPSVDALAREIPTSLPGSLVVEVVRAAIDRARQAIEAGETADPGAEARAEVARLERLRPTVVINATGVLLHTNLGRAPLAPEAAEAAREAACGYGNLEFDLTSGRRGGRGSHVRRLLRSLTGAEAAVVVNNNAGALFLALMAIGGDGEVPVSRGELIEIGGSYRLPELIGATRATMVEVGTTNRTRRSDYERALSSRTTMLLRIHPSNYRVVGFAEDPTLEEIVSLGREHDLPVVFDAGSGLLDANVPWLPGAPPSWLAGEPGVKQSLAAGADLVLFSGDKLLGGPQAGIAVGRSELIDRMARHPIARAMRTGGPVLAALAATLELYAHGHGRRIPFWQMATTTYEELRTRVERLLPACGDRAVEVRGGSSLPGAGSVPGAEVPSPVLVVGGGGVDHLWHRLLQHDPPLVARRDDGELIIDLRAVRPDQDGLVAAALQQACRS
jgi:L-seryl-tRNA(Ser) seleniumtransferase